MISCDLVFSLKTIHVRCPKECYKNTFSICSQCLGGGAQIVEELQTLGVIPKYILREHAQSTKLKVLWGPMITWVMQIALEVSQHHRTAASWGIFYLAIISNPLAQPFCTVDWMSGACYVCGLDPDNGPDPACREGMGGVQFSHRWVERVEG